MVLGSIIRQSKQKVEMAIKYHQEMDANQFKEFFNTLTEMKESLERTCCDVEAEVEKIR